MAIDISDFFTTQKEEEGVWFEPKVKGVGIGIEFKAIEVVGQDFNTDFHEAIAMIPAANDEQKGKVIDCVQTGYMLNEKVIRHAKVAIGQ